LRTSTRVYIDSTIGQVLETNIYGVQFKNEGDIMMYV